MKGNNSEASPSEDYLLVSNVTLNILDFERQTLHRFTVCIGSTVGAEPSSGCCMPGQLALILTGASFPTPPCRSRRMNSLTAKATRSFGSLAI